MEQQKPPALKVVLLDAREKVWQSAAKDFVTFSLLLLAIYGSRHSVAWIFVSVALMFLWLNASIALSRKRRHHFKGLDELQKWVNDQKPEAD